MSLSPAVETTAAAAIAAGLLWAGLLALRAGRRLRGTTLRPAWVWSLVALLCWSSAWLIPRVREGFPPERQDGLWYLAGVLGLCPWMGVLGARRPGVGVWTWFVLLPLVAVLTLPVLGRGWPVSTAVQIPLPLMLGYTLVLLMGVGNYVGTRYTGPAALAALAHCLVLAPLSDAAPDWLPSAAFLRAVGTAGLVAAVAWADGVSRRGGRDGSPLERLWCDYRDTFGIVWGRRLLERVNQRAAAEDWSWRLTDDGLVPHPPQLRPAAPEGDPRIEHTFRWLLRRFVDPSWIDRRLTVQADPKPRRAGSTEDASERVAPL